MEFRRCTHVCRKEYIHYHLEKGNHVFNLAQKVDPDFPQQVVQQEQVRFYERLRSLIAEKLGILIVKTGISVNRASQDAIRTFTLEMIQIGMSFANKHLKLDEAIIDFSRRILTEQVLRFGTQMKERDIACAREAHFVNLLVDAGTVLGKGVIHAMLSNPYHPGLPIILDLIENDGYDKWKYKQLFSFLIYQCIKQGLTVCAVITDGLRAQRTALMELIEEAEDQNIRAIFPVYCMAHLTQLVFTDTLNRCNRMKEMMNKIHSFVSLLRTSVVTRELGEKCPSLCPTRWLYVVDILIWIDKRKEKINAFLLASENNSSDLHALPDEWRRLLMILLPLKRLSLAMESSDCCLWEVIPILERIMNMWKAITSLLTEPDAEILSILLTRLITRLSHASPSVVAAAYSLSEMGRLVLRQREKGLQTRRTEEEESYATERIVSLDKWCREGVAETSILDEQNQSENEVAEGFRDVDGENEQMADEDACMIGEMPNEDFEEATPDDLLSLNVDELLRTPVYHYDFSIAFAEIKRLGDILGIGEEYLYQRYRAWLFDKRSDTPTRHETGESPDRIWRCVPAIDNTWRDFAHVALRLVTINTSEADCERSLARQRDVHGIRTSNISTDLLEAFMRSQ